jgi:hypothetical protein
MTAGPASGTHARPTPDQQSEAAIAAALRALFIARRERVLEFERRIAAFALVDGTRTSLKCS